MLCLQPARCTNVIRLGHLVLHSEVVSAFGDRKLQVIVNCENDLLMKEAKKVRSILLPIRLNAEEKKKLNSLYSRTTCNSLSEYARFVLLNEPVNFLYRNQTADEFLAEMIQLKKELNAIGNNFNQAVHRMHTLDHVAEIKVWTIMNETRIKAFLIKVEEIKERMNQIYSLWSQK